MFIHLNVKSCYTLMNSIIKVDNLLDKTSRMKSESVAITDINTMHTFFDFEQHALKKDKKCKNAKRDVIKPIFGITFMVESTIANEFFNLTLLAKDNTGYQNLIQLSTIANTNHKQFAYVPLDTLAKYSDGLICLTGGEEGEIFYLVTHDRYDDAVNYLQKLKDIYHDNLYLEVSNHFLPEEKVFLESGFIDDALNLGVDYVATNNCYYLKKEDAPYRSLAVSMNSELANLKASEIDWVHQYASRHIDYNDEFYVKTEMEMKRAFKDYLKKYPRLLSNTVEIAHQCHASVPITKTFPEFPLPVGYSEESYFRELMLKGFDERFPDEESLAGFSKEDYINRMEYEFNTVKQMGFLGYLLIVQDYINFAKDDKVFEHPEKYFPKNIYQDYSKIPEHILNKNFSIRVGPGRGSGAGALLCYLLNITNLNPLEHGLLFERFLNCERISMPDLDVDFENQYRYMIIEYVQAKYGFAHVSQIVTYNELGVKSIIKNVGKVLGIPYAVTDDLSKNVPKTIRKHVYLDEEDTWEDRDEPVKTLDDLKNLKFFKDKIDNNEDIAQLFKIGKLFDGLPSSTGKHACGVIIGPKPLNEFVALMEVDGVLVSQFEKKASEAIGLLKMDFLGLITLDIEEETLRLIKQVHGVDVDLDRIPMDDKKVFELLQKGQSAKVFQLESQGMQNLLKKMHPTNFGHINAVISLFREHTGDVLWQHSAKNLFICWKLLKLISPLI